MSACDNDLMSVTLSNPDGLFAPANYSQVASATGSRTIYVAGQLGVDADGRLAGTDLASQSAQAFRNLEAALRSAGASPQDVAKLTIYVVGFRPELLPDVQQGRAAVFAEHRPAAALVGVSSLAGPDFLIEVEAVAVLD